MLVREAVQNCWDAKRRDERGITRRDRHDGAGPRRPRCSDRDAACSSIRRPGSRSPTSCGPAWRSCTSRTSGPTVSAVRLGRPRQPGQRDFVDFVRNIGQPPDKELGGGSFGYGKAAFYIASRARTILVDTLCETPTGASSGGSSAAHSARTSRRRAPYTGRHWWGRVVDGVPSRLLDDEAAAAARAARAARSAAAPRASARPSRSSPRASLLRRPTRTRRHDASSSPRRWSGTSGRG